MILLVCVACNKALRISPGDRSGELSESEFLFGEGSEFYPDRFPCYSCGEHAAELVTSSDKEARDALDITDVTPIEAFAAINGMGLPKERECSAEIVSALFASQSVVGVDVATVKNTGRSVLNRIDFADGTRVFLCSSTHGALVYRITPPHSYKEAHGR